MTAVLAPVPGLECLTNLLTIKINQTSSGGYYGCNYAVLTNDEVLFNLVEDRSTHGMLFSGGRYRPFIIHGVDNAGRKLFSLRRQGSLLEDHVELYINDELVSVVRLEPTFFTPLFSINDAQNQPTLRVKGRGADQTHYMLQTPTKTTIGSIDKMWLGWGRELTSLKNNYVIIFPGDLAVQFKVAVIVACVFIDFRFFEGK